MSFNTRPEYEWNVSKEGFPAITRLDYGILLIVIRDDTDQTFYKKEYQRFGDITEAEYTAENYGYFQDIFTYPINKLIVYRMDVAGTLTTEVQDNIKGLIIDFGVMPSADATDVIAIISMVREARSEFLTHKWFLEEQVVNPDEPWFAQYDVNSPQDSEGTALTVNQLLPTITAQRVSKPLTQSITYDIAGKIADFIPFTKTEENAKLAAGVIVPIKKHNAIKYARDINSLVTLGDTYDERFRANQIFSTIDTINRDIRFTWETQYVGNFVNNGDNKRGLIATLNKYIKDRAGLATDPVQDGLFYVDWEEHRDVLRVRGFTEDQINALDRSALEDIDTSTFVYIDGQIQINGVMEDIRFNVTLATTVITPVELQG